MSLAVRLINMAVNARIRLWLRLRYPNWFTVDEVAGNLTLLSKQRIQQILQREFEAGKVSRRRRNTSNPGPNPFEYQVSPILFSDLNEGELDKLRNLE